MSQPQIFRVSPKSDLKDLQKAALELKLGSLVIVPTDTVYGVAADALQPDAVEKIYLAKSRENRKPIPILAAGLVEIEVFGATLGCMERALAEAFWPGPLTLVLAVGSGTEGFRVPDHEVALELLRLSGGILRVSSANISGEPPALSAEDAIRSLGNHVRVVVDSGPSPGGAASTVARVSGDCIEILREGAISLERLEEACR